MSSASYSSLNCFPIPAWEDCNCDESDIVGYDNTDGPYTYCVGTVQMVARSLTDEKNCDDPLEGSQKEEPTWSLITYDNWMASKQDNLSDCAGELVPAGTQMVTCADLTVRLGALDIPEQVVLLNCAGDTLVNNDRVASCAELQAGLTAVTNSIPVYTKCGGDEVDGPLLQCDQLSADFSVAADGSVTINFPTATEADGVVTSGTYANGTLTLQRSVGAALVIPDLPTQYALVDCEGNNIPSGTAVATCVDLDTAIAEVTAAGGDGTVTGGSVTGNTLTLERSVGADVTITGLPQGVRLEDCDGVDHVDGNMVPTCGQMTTAIADAVAAVPTYSIVDCDGDAIPAGTAVATCDNMNAAIAEIQAAGGSDGVVTSGSFAGETLTLQRSIGAPVTIGGFAQVQNLQGCDGELLAPGSQVPSCVDFNRVDNSVTVLADNQTQLITRVGDVETDLATKQDKIKNLNDADIVVNQQVVARNNLNGGDFTIAANGDLHVNFPTYVDCDGNDIPTTEAIATCAAMNAAIAEIQAAGGSDGVVTGGSVSGSQLTLTRSIGAAVTVTLPTYNLVDCDGAAIPAGSAVPTCADLAASIADAVAGRQVTLNNLAGADLVTDQQIVARNNLNGGDFTIAANGDLLVTHNEYLDCNGTAIANGDAVATCTDLTTGLATRSVLLNNLNGDGFVNNQQVVARNNLNGGDFTIDAGGNLQVVFPEYQDCDGNAIPVTEPLATCAAMNAAIAEIQAAGGSDGVVTNGSVTGNTLTLTRSIGAAVSINLPGYGLVDCSGADIDTGDAVATCTDLTTGLNTRQLTLANLAGAGLVANQQVVARNNLNGGDFAIAANGDVSVNFPAIPAYTDCNGATIAVDTPIVTCDNFGERFDDLLENSCLTLQDLGTTCGATSRVIAVECDSEPGKYKLGIISEASSEYGNGGFDHHVTTGELWPATAGTTAGIMTYQEADTRIQAAGNQFANLSTADQNTLNDYRLFCASHNAACDETIDFTVSATVSDTDANLTATQFIYSVNGTFQVNAAGLQGLASFNNKVTNFTDTISIPVSAGANTICVYMIKPNNSRLLTQFSIRNSGGIQRPVWRISKSGV